MNQNIQSEDQSQNTSEDNSSRRLPENYQLLDANTSKLNQGVVVLKASKNFDSQFSPEKQELQQQSSMAINLSQFQQPEHLQEVSNKNLSEGSLKQSSLTVPQQVSKKIHQESSPVQQFQQLVVLEPQQTQATQGQLRNKIQFPTTTQFLCSAIFRLLQNPNQDDNQIQEFKKQLKEYLRIKESLMQIVQTQMRIIKIFVLKPHEIRLDNINALDQSSLRLMLEKLLYTNLDQFTRNHISSLFRQYIQCKSNSLSYQLEQEIVIQLLQNLSIRKMFDFQTITQTQNLVKTSDLENEQYSQENKKLLYCLVIELLARPYPSKEQVSYLKVQIKDYANEKDPKLQNKYLRDLKGYYVQRDCDYPLTKVQIQAQWQNYKLDLIINDFIMGFLENLLSQELANNQISQLQGFVKIDNCKKPQEQNYQTYIREQLAKIQSICISPEYKQCKVYYTEFQLEIIREIEQLFRVLNNEIPIEQQDKIIEILKIGFNPDENIILKKNYSSEEYFATLLKLIKKAMINYQFFTNLQWFAIQHPKVFTDHFQIFLKRKSIADRILLETYYIWIFQKQRFHDQFGKCIQNIVGSRAYYLKLQEQDIRLIEQMIYSQGAWEAILQINSYAQKTQDQLHEYTDLLYFLRNQLVISFDIDNVSGITLLNGSIGLNRRSVYPYGSDNRKRALTIVTLLHETFGHKKRIEYVNPDNVLKVTPKKLGKVGDVSEDGDKGEDSDEGQDGEKGEDDESGEAGAFVEIMTFGKSLDGVSDQQADYILNSANWTQKKSSQTIISEFSSLQGLPKIQKLKGSDRQTLKQSNREEPPTVIHCALRKEKRQRKE